jgi:hypothetical protein
MTGLAMKMKLELSQLARRHRVEPVVSCALPLAPPSPRPVMITGIAATEAIDQERMCFASRSLMFLLAATALVIPPSRARRRDPQPRL